LSTELSREDAKNGWTLASLRAYQREREKAFPVVAGNIVTEFKRPKAPVRIEGASMAYNPLTRSFG
jgi:hypothetical protein